MQFSQQKKKKKKKLLKISFSKKTQISVWYMCLKTENCYSKTFVKVHVDKKVCRNTCNVV